MAAATMPRGATQDRKSLWRRVRSEPNGAGGHRKGPNHQHQQGNHHDPRRAQGPDIVHRHIGGQ